MFIIASHVAYSKDGDEIFGPANNIGQFLDGKNKEYVFIKHSLDGKRQSEVLDKNGRVCKVGRFFGKNMFLQSFENIFINIKRGWGKDIFFIGIDPLNGLSGIVLRFLGRTSKFVYLTPDYTETRFENSILNKIYHLIDRICLKLSNEVWSVSTRIVDKRKSQGLSDDKNKLIPNSPDFNSVKRKDYDGNQDLVIVSPLTKILDFNSVVRIIKKLSQKYEKVRLQVVGSGDEEDNFKRIVLDNGLEEKIIFLGWKEHDAALEVITSSFLGFALYTKVASWNKYGDSMKAREYVACGVPVIISSLPSTADDVSKYEAGLVVDELNDSEVERVFCFVEKCVLDRDYYMSLRSNAEKLGRDFDKNKILTELLGF